ncbi:hypothetical protein AMJ87_07255 [candidate division WOR_3 bacterium SM23_60]|uniref:Thymidylate kinase-like domain-containing protein n=1 Tax=candidate division WOR_3 bacterium SM23_60 TaxID=1703780 RepID=A0A0S8GG45_UNCW3|nr:MAG: hypothetical protein AMJ87_07255 [candidate division WOR_3 bacterium SM23_60]
MKLILVEGVAGSGKSTVGEQLAALIRANNVRVDFHYEFERGHPIRKLDLPNSIELITKTISHWQAFVDEHQSLGIAIFDGILSQCFVAELILMGADEQTIIDGVHKVLKIIEPLEPHIIFLYQDDVKESILKAYSERSERWQKKIDSFIENTEYGNKNELKGLSGYICFNQKYSALLRRIFEDSNVTSISIETSQGEWSTYYKRITDFLSRKAR